MTCYTHCAPEPSDYLEAFTYQVVKPTKLSNLPSCQTYQVVKPTKLSNLPSCQTYQVVKPTKLSNLPSCQTYQVVSPVGLSIKISKISIFFGRFGVSGLYSG
ncbi:hypothetical protein N7G274_004732 [Stereocaulon virgatum]|uniref:Uncharacterized protein n=1 Tax=Stereocaulon virgatum TaxID=373712 RepID=A0ABR4AC30_9LECA